MELPGPETPATDGSATESSGTGAPGTGTSRLERSSTAAPVTVARDVELDAPAEEAWELIGAGSGWAEWMVDDADVVVEPGRHGTVREGGARRSVRIGEVVPGERVSFDWWTPGDDSAGSTVDLELLPSGTRTLLRIVETFPAPRRAAARARVVWDVRAMLASARCTALVAA